MSACRASARPSTRTTRASQPQSQSKSKSKKRKENNALPPLFLQAPANARASSSAQAHQSGSGPGVGPGISISPPASPSARPSVATHPPSDRSHHDTSFKLPAALVLSCGLRPELLCALRELIAPYIVYGHRFRSHSSELRDHGRLRHGLRLWPCVLVDRSS